MAGGEAAREPPTTMRADTLSAAAEVRAEGIPQAADVAEMPASSARPQEGGRDVGTPRSAGAVSESHSLRRAASQVYKSFTSPRNAVLGAGTVLALCAGIVDAVCLNELGSFTTHVTGNVAHIGIRIEGNYNETYTLVELRKAFLLVASFLTGSIMCGLIISRSTEVRFGKELYGFALLGNSFFLVLATFVPNHECAMYLAAASAGLQNGICTIYFGAVCRTTHVTGLVTDLGTATGRILHIVTRRLLQRQKLDILDRSEIHVDLTRMKVYSLLISGFFLGAVFGSFLAHFCGIYGMLVPASITFCGGASYMVFHLGLKDKLRAWEAERVSEEMHEVENILARARTFMASCQHGDGANDEQNFNHLDGAMSHVIDVMHDVEDSIGQLYGGQHPELYGVRLRLTAPATSTQSSPARRLQRQHSDGVHTPSVDTVVSEPSLKIRARQDTV
mmetsp:Transcript_12734/g.37832  ORF Transcript_12734/g.37832 Transcript_12734/m.37832 type:complete len:448 (+) Transcript_12734:91-1434(+)